MGGFTAYTSPSPSASEMRVMMAPAVIMLIRMMVLACLVMMRYLLDLLTLLSPVTKMGSSFDMRVVIYIGGKIA